MKDEGYSKASLQKRSIDSRGGHRELTLRNLQTVMIRLLRNLFWILQMDMDSKCVGIYIQ